MNLNKKSKENDRHNWNNRVGFNKNIKCLCNCFWRNKFSYTKMKNQKELLIRGSIILLGVTLFMLIILILFNLGGIIWNEKPNKRILERFWNRCINWFSFFCYLYHNFYHIVNYYLNKKSKENENGKNNILHVFWGICFKYW